MTHGILCVEACKHSFSRLFIGRQTGTNQGEQCIRHSHQQVLDETVFQSQYWKQPATKVKQQKSIHGLAKPSQIFPENSFIKRTRPWFRHINTHTRTDARRHTNILHTHIHTRAHKHTSILTINADQIKQQKVTNCFVNFEDCVDWIHRHAALNADTQIYSWHESLV